MLKRPWPKVDALLPPVSPAPDCINASYGAYDPDASRKRRQRISTLAVCVIFAAGFFAFTFGLRPTVAVLLALFDIAEGRP